MGEQESVEVRVSERLLERWPERGETWWRTLGSLWSACLDNKQTNGTTTDRKKTQQQTYLLDRKEKQNWCCCFWTDLLTSRGAYTHMVYRPIWYCLYVPLWGDVYSTGCLLRQSYAWKMVRRCSDSSLNVFMAENFWDWLVKKTQNPYGLKHTLRKSLNTDVSSYASFYVLLCFEISLISIHSSTFCIFSVATRGTTVGISVNVFFTFSFLFQVNYYYGSLRLASAKKIIIVGLLWGQLHNCATTS